MWISRLVGLVIRHHGIRDLVCEEYQDPRSPRTAMAEGSTVELLKELGALRAEVQALPERVAIAASKEIKREAKTAHWTLLATILAVSLLEHYGF